MKFLKTTLATLPILASTALAEPSLPVSGVFEKYTEIKEVVVSPKSPFIEVVKERYQHQLKAFLNKKHELYIYDPLNKRLLNYDDYLYFIKERGNTYTYIQNGVIKAICEHLFFSYQDLAFGKMINERLILKDKGIYIYLSNDGNLSSLLGNRGVSILAFEKTFKQYKMQCLEDFSNVIDSLETKRQLELLK